MCPDATDSPKNISHSSIDADDRGAIIRDLTAWFSEAQRILNFRETTDPYAVTVSEFMLQQTTVATVQPYFARFMRKYPAVASLAVAPEDEVMAMWAGLGYYRRARQLQATAKLIVAEHGGQFPRDVASLQKLPGFGRYTAAAVLSQSYDIPAPILEANTIRVFARIAGIRGIIGESAFMNQLWAVSENFVQSAASPREFNRAAMELGALICRPKPACKSCPLQTNCIAYISGFADQTPKMRPRRQVIPLDAVTVVLRNRDSKYAVRKIPAGEWHAGLWEFPTALVKEGESKLDVASGLAARYGFRLPESIKPVLTLKYPVTHHRVTCSVFHCQPDYANVEKHFDSAGISFQTIDEISKLPMGSAQKKILRILEKEKGDRIADDSRR